MSRPTRHADGWVQLPTETWGEASLFLPSKLAERLLFEKEASAAAQAAELAAEEEAAKAAAALASEAREIAEHTGKWGTVKAARQKRFAESTTLDYEVGHHSIFANFREVNKRLDGLRDGLYHNKDEGERAAKALAKAIAAGRTRPVVRPPTWRSDLEALTVEFPAFRAAIHTVRNAYALSEATGARPVVPPMLLVGPPGVGKSHFCRRLAETLRSGTSWIAMDDASSAGATLRGSDAVWSSTRHGVLFELLGLGKSGNPLVVLDEIDKASRSYSSRGVDQLAQLYSALEPETACHLTDVSLDVELDASLVMYVATANCLANLDAPLLSRFEVISVGLPPPEERRDAALRIAQNTLTKMGLSSLVSVQPGCAVLLEEYSPRVIKRAVERAMTDAYVKGRRKLTVEDLEVALGLGNAVPMRYFH